MSTLEKRECTKPTWHGPHDFWWTDSGGGHMLAYEPTEIDREIERGLIQYTCPGKGADGPTGDAPEPDSEQMFRGFDAGVKLGRKQMIELVYEALCDAANGDAIQSIAELLEEANIKP